MSSRASRPRTSSRSRRQRLAAGAVLATTGLLGTYLAAIKPQPTYASPGASPRSTPGTTFGMGVTSGALVGLPTCAEADVTVTDESGLKAAITGSVDDSVICIDGLITLTEDLPRLFNTTVTFVGDDSTTDIIDGNEHSIIRAEFLGAEDDTVTVNSLTLRNAKTTGRGSAVFVFSKSTDNDGLIISDAVIANSSSTANGGAVYGKGADVTIQDSVLSGNETSSSYAGGAVFVKDASSVVSGSTFTDNAAGYNGGGGLSTRGPAQVSDSVFTNNTTDGYGGGAQFGAGVTLTRSLFEGNSSSNSGAGVSVSENYGTSVIEDSSFIRNGLVTTPFNGGGAFFSGGGEIQVINSTFYANESTDQGGAITAEEGKFSLLYSSIVNNVSDSSEGIAGVTVTYAISMSVTNSLLYNNLRGTEESDLEKDSETSDWLMSNNVLTSETSSNVASAVSAFGDPELGVLGDNGGPRIGAGGAAYLPTLLPASGSIALGAASSSFAEGVTTDQIGSTRAELTAGAIDGAGAPLPPVPPIPPAPVPVFPPSAPLTLVGVAVEGAADVSWKVPTSAGSFPVTAYQVVTSPGGQSCLVAAPVLTCTVTGLIDNTVYTARVRALSGAGWSPYSLASNEFTPAPAIAKSMVITGSRSERGKHRVVRVEGATTDLSGVAVQARVKLAGQLTYAQGSSRIVSAEEEFTWQRRTGKKTYVYFVGPEGDVRSNRVIIPGR